MVWGEDENSVNPKAYTALAESTVAFITNANMTRALGRELRGYLQINNITEQLVHVKILRSLPLNELQSVAACMSLREYEPNSVIIQEGEPGLEFFIIKQGSVSVIIKGAVVRILEESAFFGERAILLNEPRTATVRTNGRASCWVLNQDDFLQFADEALLSFLRSRMLLQDDSIALQDLVYVKKAGEGSFGIAEVLVNPSNEAVYCVKTVTKKKIIENRMFNSVLNERKILL